MAAINVHQAKDGTKTYRVRVRRKGPTVQTASFPSMQDARKWATMIATEIIAGKYFPASKPKHTLSALLDRYVQEIMPRKTLATQRFGHRFQLGEGWHSSRRPLPNAMPCMYERRTDVGMVQNHVHEVQDPVAGADDGLPAFYLPSGLHELPAA